MNISLLHPDIYWIVVLNLVVTMKNQNEKKEFINKGLK